MNLDDVRIFTKVAELGSFTRAAQHLELPKSTVSRRVAELEDQLKVRLLQRSTRKLTLTHAGELYFARTSRAIEDLRQAETALEEMQNEPRGLLRITIPGDMNGIIPRMLKDFQVEYPLIDVVVFSTGRRVDLIAEGYDLALRAGILTDSTLVSKKLLDSTLGVYASPAYLTENGTPTRVAELSEHECLCFGTDGTRATWKLSTDGEIAEIPVKGRVSSNDLSLLLSCCLGGQGIALLPTFEADLFASSGALVRLLPQSVNDFGALYAVYPSPRHLSPKVRALIDFTSAWLTKCSNIYGKPCPS